MPRGDRTGPMGARPRTGRGLGYCGGYDIPAHPAFGPLMGWRHGGGGGFGWRHRFFMPPIQEETVQAINA